MQRGAQLSLISQPHLLPVGLTGFILHSPTLVSHPHYFTSHLKLARGPSSEHAGHGHRGSGMLYVLCHVGRAVTKIIPLPPGPSIVPLQQAEPTLGNPLKCLFGPVAGDPHLTDMMRKGKRHLCQLSRMGLNIYGCDPWLLPSGGTGEVGGMQRLSFLCLTTPAAAPPGTGPAQECQGYRAKPKQSRGAIPEPWPKSSLFSGHQKHTVTISEVGTGLKAH